MSSLSRRDFLKLTSQALLAASGLLGLGGLFRFLSYQTGQPPPTKFDLGPAANYLPGSRTVMLNIPAVLLHTKRGYSALSMACTHLNCTVDAKETGFACPCHGSKFDMQGALLRGPAQKPLRSLRVEQTAEGKLILYTD